MEITRENQEKHRLKAKSMGCEIIDIRLYHYIQRLNFWTSFAFILIASLLMYYIGYIDALW